MKLFKFDFGDIKNQSLAFILADNAIEAKNKFNTVKNDVEIFGVELVKHPYKVLTESTNTRLFYEEKENNSNLLIFADTIDTIIEEDTLMVSINMDNVLLIH